MSDRECPYESIGPVDTEICLNEAGSIPITPTANVDAWKSRAPEKSATRTAITATIVALAVVAVVLTGFFAVRTFL